MSLDATRWAWMQNRGIRPAMKLVLLAIADRAGSDDCAFPSVKTMSEDTTLDRKAIIRAIKNLCDIGLMKDTGQRRGPTARVIVYQLVGVDHRCQDDCNSTQMGTVPKVGQYPNGTVNGPQSGTVPKVEQYPNGTCNGPQSGTLNGPQSGTRNLPVEPTMEPLPHNPPRKPKPPCKPAPDLATPTGVDPTAWTDFTAHRADIRKPLTPAAADKAANLLRTMTAEQQRASVDATVLSGWTGLFPPKTNGAAKPAPAASPRLADILAESDRRASNAQH